MYFVHLLINITINAINNATVQNIQINFVSDMIKLNDMSEHVSSGVIFNFKKSDVLCNTQPVLVTYKIIVLSFTHFNFITYIGILWNDGFYAL